MINYKLDNIPEWFSYPEEFNRITRQSLVDLTPWYILSNDQLKKKFEGLGERFPSLHLVPFAKRDDNDDVACWCKAGGNVEVIVIHDFASAGFEVVQSYGSFWAWFKAAIEDMIEFEP
jgi:hypothetical protein